MPLNPLSIFYSVPRWELSPAGYIQISWRSDPDALREIARAGKFEITGVSLVNLPEINTYIDRLLLADSQLATVVVADLYRLAAAESNPIGHNCWFNFITAMTFRAALHIWRRVPKPQQSEELFEQLVTPVLIIQQLFNRFDPGYHPDLLVGIQAWTYSVVTYNSFAYLRKNGHPYFGLSNFGIISRSGWRVIRTALRGNIIPEQVEADASICKIFKTYLERSRIRVNRLEPHHWQEILTEIRSKSIDLTIDELRGRIDRIGGLIRAQASPIIEQHDDLDRFGSIDNRSSSDLDLQAVNETLLQIFALLDRFMDNLSVEDRKIMQLRHHQKLTQNDIAESIAKDRFSSGQATLRQSFTGNAGGAVGVGDSLPLGTASPLAIRSQSTPMPIDWHELSQSDIRRLVKQYQPYLSRRLGKIYLNIIDCIHERVPHPNGRDVQKNSLAIDAIKQLLEKYFCRTNISSST